MEEIIKLLLAGEVDKVKPKFKTNQDRVKEALKHYDIEQHTVMDQPETNVRKTENGEIADANINWRLPIAYQNKIVQQSSTFLVGKPVKLIQESENTDQAFELLTHIWNEIRQDSKNLEVATLLFSETECAKRFVDYRDADADPNDLTKRNSVRTAIFAKSKGDTLYTKFDEYGGFQAFARGYSVPIADNKTQEHFDVETPEMYYDCKRVETGWEVTTRKNLTGKINTSYYTRPTWDSQLVDKLIERREFLSSRRANNNDAMGDPILVLTGSAESMPGISDDVKVVMIDVGGKAEYLYPQMAVDLIKEEREDLEKLINYITDTIDLTSEGLKSMGQDSGKALIMKFFPAELKAIFNRIYFKEMLDREINIIKRYITQVIDTSSSMKEQINNLVVTIEFSTPLPDDITDIVNNLATATGGKPSMSQEEAAHLNPMVKNGAANWNKLQEESSNEALTLE